MAHVGYARVSPLDQDLALQLDALAVAGCAKVFEDRSSGARADREGLRAALDYVRGGEVLVVWKLDRLGRSLPHLIETVSALERRGAARVGASRLSPRTSSGARERMAKGLTVREVATRVKVGKTALYEALRAEPA
jgi:predicted site-specific integrase-resolvase